jgi:hypothetical protein
VDWVPKRVTGEKLLKYPYHEKKTQNNLTCDNLAGGDQRIEANAA